MISRLRPLLATTLLGAIAVAGVGSAADTDPKGALTCVGALDAAGLDSVLTRADSPLAGEGATFVNTAAAWGLDPRVLVAIAAHETILATYAPAQAIHNPFGIGPGRVFATHADAIGYAATLLGRNYVGEGRVTLAQISGKWAPIGAANDPANLNANWTGGVGASYRRLGGDPAAPITLADQIGVACETPTAPAQVPPSDAMPTPGAIAWSGTAPRVDQPLMERGADPTTGAAATIDGFVFPMVPSAAPVVYADEFAEPGTPGCYGRAIRCATTIAAQPGTTVVAATGGVLLAATASEQDEGIAFWIVSPGGDRLGYGGLASYAAGIAERAMVVPGQALGTSTSATRFAWERSGHRVNPFPLLSATFPSQG